MDSKSRVYLPHEDTVNTIFSEVLSEIIGNKGVVVPENKSRGKRFDIRIEYKGVEFVLEGSFDKNDAIKDARKRIEEGLVDTVSIAIYYNPTYFASAKTVSQIRHVLSSNPIEAKVFAHGIDISGTLLQFIFEKKSVVREVTGDWIHINITEFGEFLDSILEFVVKEDILSKLLVDIDEAIYSFVNDIVDTFNKNKKLKSKLIEDLYKILFSPSEEDDLMVPNVPDDVLLAHAYISLLMASTLYESVSPQHGKDSLQRLMSKHRNHPLLAMKEAFTEILEINYEPVFDIAVAVLDCLFALQGSPNVMQHLRDLINIALHVVSNKAVLRQDFIGHVYHKVTGDIATRKSYATYYTKTPIAYFLAYLALGTPNEKWNFDWSNLDTLKNFLVCDLACGSGTLLSAAYSAMLSKHRAESLNRFDSPNLSEFHKYAIENSIWGFDALEHAVQTASVVLSLHEPSIPLDTMNMYHIPVDGRGSLGSLNFWWANMQLVPIRRRTVSEVVRKEVAVPKFDLIIMNPPFARSTAPGEEGSRPRIFDFAAEQVIYERLWEEYKKLISNITNVFVPQSGRRINTKVKELFDKYVGKNKVFLPQNVNPLNAGASLPFVFLADKYLKEGGRLALVLPKTVLEGSSYFLLRAMLLAKYQLEYIVLSAEEGNSNFSYSTDFSEILLVARKCSKKEEQDNGVTYIICFNNQPRTTLEGTLFAKEFLNKINKIQDLDVISALSAEAKVYKISRKTLEEFVWNLSILIDAPQDLSSLITNIVDGNILGVKVPIHSILELSTKKGMKLDISNPRAFRGRNFSTYFSYSKSGRYRILTKTGKNIVKKLLLNLADTELIIPRSSDAEDRYHNKSGRLLIPEALRFNTTPLVATWSDEPIISSVAFILAMNNLTAERALCVWLNSTFTILYLWTLFSTVEEMYGHIRGWHIRTIPIPDLTNEDVINGLEEVFVKYKNVVWDSLPEQYKNVLNESDLTRLEYDIDVLRALAKSYNQKIEVKNTTKQLLKVYEKLAEIIV